MLLRVGLSESSVFENFQSEIIEHFMNSKVRFELKYRKKIEDEKTIGIILSFVNFLKNLV
jgi:hypothetical protein